MRKIIALPLIAAVAVAGAGFAASFAAVQQNDGAAYKEGKAFDVTTGSKKTIGYFAKAGDACSLKFSMAENNDPETVGSTGFGAIIAFTLPAKADARVQDGAGGMFTVTCSAAADSVIVKVANGAS